MKIFYGSVLRYKWLTCFIITLALFDLVGNSCFLLFSHNTLATLLIYIMQNVCLVFSFILVAFGIFSTTSAQTGFLSKVLRRFRWMLLTSVLYLVLTLSFHWWSLNRRWKAKEVSKMWNDGTITFYTIQRLVAAVYYYLVKRTVLCLSDGTLYSQQLTQDFPPSS